MRKPMHSPWLVLALGVVISLALHQSLLLEEIRGRHSWRQAQTMWNIRNFERHDANIMNPRVSHFNSGQGNISRYEFPIMQWSIAMVQKGLGSHIAVVRCCMFLIGLLAVLGFYRLLCLMEVGPWAAAFGGGLFLFSPLLHAYVVSPLPDILALAGGVWYLYCTLAYLRTPTWRWLLLSGVALSMATAAKLPFLMFSVVSIYFFFQSIIQTKRLSSPYIRLAVVQLVCVAPALLWYVWVIPTWPGNPVLQGVFSGHSNWHKIQSTLLFYLGTTLPSAVLNYVLVVPFIAGFFHGQRYGGQHGWVYALGAITVLYAILQSTAIGTYHDYYFFPFLPWMYIMVVLGIRVISTRYPRYANWVGGLVLAGCVIVVSHLLAAPRWHLKHSGCNAALYTYQTELKAAVPNGSMCIMLNDESYCQFSYMLDKMGYIFKDDYLPAPWIREMIDNKEVKYLYSDSRVVDEHPEVQPLLDTLLLEAGTIRVFRLVGKEE